MGWAGRSVRGRVRTPLTSLGAALALAVAATGCGVDTTDTPTSGTPPPTASGSTIVGVTPGTRTKNGMWVLWSPPKKLVPCPRVLPGS